MTSFKIGISLFLFFGIFILFSSCQENQNHFNQTFPLSESPGPSDEDDPNRDSLKQVYWDQLYYADEGTNVDSIRAENLKRNLIRKKIKRQEAQFRNSNETFANNKIVAEWHERGPNNEAGDVREVAYLPSDNSIYAISTVGHLWKGSLGGGSWALLDDASDFDSNILHAMPHNGGARIFACYGSGNDDKKVRYSDNDGSTWTQGTGFDFYDHWGSARRFISLSDDNTIFYLVHTWQTSPWGQVVQLYVSTDKGDTYTEIWESPAGYHLKDVDLWKPHDSDDLYLMDNEAQNFYNVTFDSGTSTATVSAPISYSGQGLSTGDFHLSGRWNSTASAYEFFVNLDANQNVYKSTDGANWTYVSTSSDNVWRKGWLANPNNDHLYVGSFQLNQATMQTNWRELYDQWWEYYKGTKDSIHVDIMNLDYYETSVGTPFILICNHAGLHVTYDDFVSTQNLGLNGLNVTTLYDQTTASDGFLYCGAQDKGTFTTANSTGNFNILSTDNRTTGDGMVGVFFNNDQSYYGMIQNGGFAVVPDRNSSDKTWYTIPGNHKSGWINPMVGTPDPSDNKAYMAGGNLTGGNGCYLIEMDVVLNGNNVTFNPTQFNYDFRANSDSGTSVIKAIGVAPSDGDRLYVATQDATFFYSTDGGSNWTKSTASLPSGLLPWEIIVGSTNPDWVIISGTGSSNTGVYESFDGGVSFSPLSTNIPAATISEVAFDDTEAMLFAATSDGPYVYLYEDASWYSLVGAETPLLNWNTVDNIGNNVIRFGTYGRGVWDFEIVQLFLPVELTAFNAFSEDNKTVQIEWETATEINIKNFEIQHSTTNGEFQTIEKITAKGNSQVPQNYETIHENPNAGDNYYRLRINDLDGSFEYSDFKIVNIRSNETEFSIYPNPMVVNGTLTLKPDNLDSYSISIYDVSGQLIFQNESLNGKQLLQPNLSKGTYFYQINNEKESLKSGQLVVQ